jgi:hypothetical protein
MSSADYSRLRIRNICEVVRSTVKECKESGCGACLQKLDVFFHFASIEGLVE